MTASTADSGFLQLIGSIPLPMSDSFMPAWHNLVLLPSSIIHAHSHAVHDTSLGVASHTQSFMPQEGIQGFMLVVAVSAGPSHFLLGAPPIAGAELHSNIMPISCYI